MLFELHNASAYCEAQPIAPTKGRTGGGLGRAQPRSRASSPGETPAGDDCQKNLSKAGDLLGGHCVAVFLAHLVAGGGLPVGHELVVVGERAASENDVAQAVPEDHVGV